MKNWVPMLSPWNATSGRWIFTKWKINWCLARGPNYEHKHILTVGLCLTTLYESNKLVRGLQSIGQSNENEVHVVQIRIEFNDHTEFEYELVLWYEFHWFFDYQTNWVNKFDTPQVRNCIHTPNSNQTLLSIHPSTSMSLYLPKSSTRPTFLQAKPSHPLKIPWTKIATSPNQDFIPTH